MDGQRWVAQSRMLWYLCVHRQGRRNKVVMKNKQILTTTLF